MTDALLQVRLRMGKNPTIIFQGQPGRGKSPGLLRRHGSVQPFIFIIQLVQSPSSIRRPSILLFTTTVRSWDETAVEQLLNCVKEHLDVINATSIGIWAERCNREAFAAATNMDPSKIKTKYHSLRRAYLLSTR